MGITLQGGITLHNGDYSLHNGDLIKKFILLRPAAKALALRLLGILTPLCSTRFFYNKPVYKKPRTRHPKS